MNEPILIDNFLKEDERKLLATMGKIFIRSNKHFYDHQDGASISSYGVPIIEALLINKLQLVRDSFKKKNLEPSNSFFRIYNKYAYLKEHTDRATCEYSVTIFIDSCGTYDWPIKMNGKDYFLKPGQAILYKGCDWKHSRTEFLGDWHFQCFLHFVDMDGPNSEWKFDKRKVLGESKF